MEEEPDLIDLCEPQPAAPQPSPKAALLNIGVALLTAVSLGAAMIALGSLGTFEGNKKPRGRIGFTAKPFEPAGQTAAQDDGIDSLSYLIAANQGEASLKDAVSSTRTLPAVRKPASRPQKPVRPDLARELTALADRAAESRTQPDPAPGLGEAGLAGGVSRSFDSLISEVERVERTEDIPAGVRKAVAEALMPLSKPAGQRWEAYSKR